MNPLEKLYPISDVFNPLFIYPRDFHLLKNGTAPEHFLFWRPENIGLFMMKRLSGLKDIPFYAQREDDSFTSPFIETQNPAQYADRVIDDEIIKKILFANCGSYSGLKEGVEKKIKDFADTFSLRTFSNDLGREVIIHKPFSPQILFDAMNFVERAMEGQIRRTGEKSFAHILRMVTDAFDFMKLNNDRWNKGQFIAPFAGEVVMLYPLLDIIHDFAEPDHGEVLGTIEKVDDGGKSGIKLQTKSGEPLFIPITQKYRDAFVEKIKALNGLGREAEGQFRRLDYHGMRSLYSIDKDLTTEAAFEWIEKLVKCDDRRDNFRTYPFIARKYARSADIESSRTQEYYLTDPQRIIDKIFETFYYFSGLESYTGWYVGEDLSLYEIHAEVKRLLQLIFSSQRADEFTQPVVSSLLRLIYLDTPAARFLPTRLALEMWLGLGLKEIYGRNDWSRDDAFNPQCV